MNFRITPGGSDLRTHHNDPFGVWTHVTCQITTVRLESFPNQNSCLGPQSYSTP